MVGANLVFALGGGVATALAGMRANARFAPTRQPVSRPAAPSLPARSGAVYGPAGRWPLAAAVYWPVTRGRLPLHRPDTWPGGRARPTDGSWRPPTRPRDQAPVPE